MTFEGKVAIITGGSSGIGAATAILYVKQGADVAIVGRNEAKLASVVDACEKLGKTPLVIVADVSKDEEAKTIIEKTINHFGRLDVLVNNAGFSVMNNGIQDPNLLENFDKVMSTNLRAVVHITGLAVPHLIKTKGNIINISSVAALLAEKRMLGYHTSKAALDHFTRCVALELAEHEVRVNTINPGPVRTDTLINSGYDKELSTFIWDKVGEQLPLKRTSESEEIADLIIYLSSEKARSITGGSYFIDGGTLLIGLTALAGDSQ